MMKRAVIRRVGALGTVLLFLVATAQAQPEPRKASRDPATPSASKPADKASPAKSSVQRAQENLMCDAIQKGDAAIVKKYLGEGVSPNTKCRTGLPAVTMAALYRKSEVLRLLLEARGSPNVAAEPDKNLQPLYLAAENGDLESVLLLLTAGAKVDVPMKTTEPKMEQANGNTALIAAANPKGKPEVIHALVKAGADVNAKNALGGTALIRACAGAPLDVVKALLEEKADANATMLPPANLTPVMGAIMGVKQNIPDRAEVIKALVAAGADINAKARGMTALALAKALGDDNIAKVIQDAGGTE